MNVKAISRNVGYALLVSALFMLFSLMVSVFADDGAQNSLLISLLITGIFGCFPFIFVRGNSEITLADGYIIIVLSWLLSFIFGMLPYALYGGPFTVSNAWFESVSGFTTTGATSLADVETLPAGLQFWRCATHFIGGLGVVVFLLLIIPASSPIRSRMTSLELSNLSQSGYSTRKNRMVYIFTYVYLTIFVLSFLSYLIAGMGPLDAVCHAFSVSATGGFSTKNDSIVGFHSTLIEGITMFFMFVSSIHFGMLYISVVNRTVKPLNNPVLKFYICTIIIVSVICGLTLNLSHTVPSFGRALWVGLFHTLATITTTGFAIADNAIWPMAINVLLLFVAVMCACAGSTTGGVKADRILIVFKAIGKQVGKILHPSSVNEVRMGNRVLRDEEVLPQLLYIGLYAIALVISTMLALTMGVNTHSSISASVSCLSNVGPSIAELGTMGNFSSLGAGAKFLFTMDMFLGRIEIYPVLAVVAMIFDHHRR